VVWFDKTLKENTKEDELATEIQRELKLLFTAAPAELE